jgi:hypothetical protein
MARRTRSKAIPIEPQGPVGGSQPLTTDPEVKNQALDVHDVEDVPGKKVRIFIDVLKEPLL